MDESNDEELTRDLIARLNQIQAAKAKVQDKEFDREVERIRLEYQKALDKATEATEKNAKKAVDKELAKLQTEYDKYIDQANSHINRVEIEGTKTSAEFTAQKIALEAEQADVMRIRQNLKNENSGGQP